MDVWHRLIASLWQSRMIQFLLVGLGGALGSMARYGAGRLIGSAASGWPTATFVVNISGGLLMGLLSALLLRLGGEPWRLLLGVGLLGGFTTFSSFSLELLLLIDQGKFWMATGYALSSVVVALLAVVAGLWIGRLFL